MAGAIAAAADHHLYISKETDGKRTRTSPVKLNADERVAELARLPSVADDSEAYNARQCLR